jgi:formate hydrogenlyase subunit 4
VEKIRLVVITKLFAHFDMAFGLGTGERFNELLASRQAAMSLRGQRSLQVC